MLLKTRLSVWTFLGIMGLTMGSAWAQSPDFQAVITGEHAQVASGQVNHYEVVVDNLGAGTSSNQIVVDINLPSGIPCDVNDYLADDPDAIAAFNNLRNSLVISDSIYDDSNTSLFFGLDSYCEFFLLQPQSLRVGANAHGTISYDAVAPSLPITTGSVHVFSADLDDELSYGVSGCDNYADCRDHPCLGPRISQMTSQVKERLELVNDGSEMPSEGCHSLNNFTPGNIALIDRGTCAFETKIVNALFAGAKAVIIADIDDFTDATTEPDDVLNMACTDFCSESLITIPAVFVSYNDGLRLHHNLSSGLTGTIGRKDLDGRLTTSARVWENSSTPEDTNQTNNSSSTTTMVISADYIFSDGFEGADTGMWTTSSGKRIALSRDLFAPVIGEARAISMD